MAASILEDLCITYFPRREKLVLFLKWKEASEKMRNIA
jgi:hypothetical protein